MPRIPRILEGDDDRFSDWIQPEMEKNYKIACCDCGLVHDMQFKIVEVVKDLGRGYKQIKNTKAGRFIVHFRARRNERSTGQMRRHKK